MIETHIYWVFLEGNYAYKIKKPIRTSFLDYATLALRKQYCGEPVEYAIQMKRFPANSPLSDRLKHGMVTLGHVRQLAGDIANFHQSAAQAEVESLFGSPDLIYNAGKAPLGILPFEECVFDWGDDKSPRHDWNLVIYELHIRGFKRDPNSGIESSRQGTFLGVVDKIPYLEEEKVSGLFSLVFIWNRFDGDTFRICVNTMA